MKKALKITGIVFLSFFVLIFLIALIFGTGNVPNKDKEKVINQDSMFLSALNKEIKIIENYKGNIDRSTIEAINKELNQFKEWKFIINTHENSVNNEIKQAANKLNAMVIDLQKKEFPLMRKSWAKISADKLWENDLYVSLTTDKIVNISGAIFAANKNIKDTQTQINDMVTSLRFTEVRYRWYKESSEYTLYKLESKKDNEL